MALLITVKLIAKKMENCLCKLPRLLIILFLLWLVLPAPLAAQQLSNLHCKKVKLIANQPLSLDTLTLIAESITLQPTTLQKNLQVQYQYATNTVVLLPSVSSTSLPDSVTICYRTFPFLFTQKHYNRSQAAYDSGLYSQDITIRQFQNRKTERVELFKADRLNKNGSITRGVSLGNRQDVFVNSALNLQLDGYLADDLHLTAVLSDQNVPFQPEGNTQRLQELDRIFIKLTHPYATLSAGDVVFQNRSSEFLRFYKNVLGGIIETDYGAKADSLNRLKQQTQQQTQGNFTTSQPRNRAYSRVGFSIAKGRFASQLLEIQEGVQGAYRLRGANGERFIVVMANSEKVFLDGKLLTRGFNYDYVIDYNTAEITFTNQIVITRYTRVRIDFEYAVQNYSRSILTATHEQQLGKLSLAGNFYREKDDEGNPLLQTLQAADIQLLQQAGDTATTVFANGAVYVPAYQADRILYFKKDTTVGNQLYTFFQRATEQQDSLFAVVFTEVGTGKGDYKIGNPTANGRTYAWVAPVNGVAQGNFAPIRLLIPPNQKQMLTAAAAYRISKTQRIFAEVAWSNNNRNLFSTISTDQTQGNALKIGWQNQKQIIKNKLLNKLLGGDSLWLDYQVDYEQDSKNFSPIDRFRFIEFDRDWAAPNATQQPQQDQILNGSLQLQNNPNNFIRIRHSRRNRGDAINGFQQSLDLAKSFGKYYTQLNLFWLQNDKKITQANWWRLTTNHYYKLNKLIVGYQFAQDHNQLAKAQTDSILSTAMYFDEHKFYLKQGDSAKWNYSADFALRTDQLPSEGKLSPSTHAQTLNLAARKQKNNQLFNFVLTYRNLKNLQPIGNQPNKIEETIMGRVDWNTFFWKNNIKSELTLATATGRELRREFRYVQVNTGTGTHTWRDDNKNGIQELNEFYLAINPDEKNYIKLFTPTDEYLAVFSNNFTYRLTVNLPKNWQQKTKILQALGKLSLVGSWAVNKKITDNNLLQRFLPTTINLADNFLQSKQDVLRATLFYNRTSPAFGIELNFAQTAQRQLLTNGFESRNIDELLLSIRKNIGKNFNTKLLVGTDRKGNGSDFLENRNFLVAAWLLRPELSYQPSQTFRLTFLYSWQQKRNVFKSTSTENAQFHDFSVESRWAEATKRTVQARLRMTNIAFVGEANSPVGYELLEALQNGTNWSWSLNWQQKLANGLQMTLIYDGRKSENQPVAHVGRVQLTALF